jgi:hypothetical protein
MDVEPSSAAAASKAKPATAAAKKAAGKAGQKKAQKPAAGGSAAVEDDASAEEPLTVSYEDYRKISNTLVSRLRDYEISEEEDEESSGTFRSLLSPHSQPH